MNNGMGMEWWRLGIQNLPPQSEKINDILFSEQSIFNGIFTNYIVTKNGELAQETDYMVSDGKIIFNETGTYIVSMTNATIIANPNYPPKVMVEINVLDDASITETTKLSNIPLNPQNYFSLQYNIIRINEI
jgi:hypothetical protein